MALSVELMIAKIEHHITNASHDVPEAKKYLAHLIKDQSDGLTSIHWSPEHVTCEADFFTEEVFKELNAVAKAMSEGKYTRTTHFEDVKPQNMSWLADEIMPYLEK